MCFYFHSDFIVNNTTIIQPTIPFHFIFGQIDENKLLGQEDGKHKPK